MRLVCLALLAAWLGYSGPARAVVVAWAGTLSLGDLGGSSSPQTFSGTGVATVNGSGGGIHLNELRLAGGITGSTAIPVTDPDSGTLLSLRVEVTLGTGSLYPFAPLAPPGQPQLTQRTLPIRGRMRFCVLFPGCVSSVPLSFTGYQGQVGMGIGGLLTVGGFSEGLAISLRGAPWTIRTASVSVTTSQGATVTLTSAGWIHGPSSFTSSTVLAGGALSLVTPMQITAGGQPSGTFARLNLRFVPEPGRLLLLTAGLGGLVATGRRRTRP